MWEGVRDRPRNAQKRKAPQRDGGHVRRKEVLRTELFPFRSRRPWTGSTKDGPTPRQLVFGKTTQVPVAEDPQVSQPPVLFSG